MKKVLILGGYGFLGTNILCYAEKHLKKKYQFIVFDVKEKHPLGINFSNSE